VSADRRADPRQERLEAAREFIAQGLVVVPYTAPRGAAKRAGKVPLRAPDGGRAECRTVEEFERYLERVPALNIAILGVAQVDADSAEAIEKVRELGVTSAGRCWMVRTRRGWKALYRKPDRKIWNQGLGVTHGLELDLLVNSPAIIPPSVHPTGVHYAWAEGHSPTDIPFADLEEPPPLLVDWWDLLCNPPDRPVHSFGGVDVDLLSAIMREVAARSPKGDLPSPCHGGWIPTTCPFPEAHQHGDRDRSFSINAEHGGWICFSGCGKGSVRELARRFGIPVGSAQRTRHGANLRRQVPTQGATP